ncbi:AraC family transcriptional regulator [Mitsuaria sp. GD03876]|uniref:AraC family transcriptional regulator n=1 Tax=Mitsuaria sp. GD03876 TaxID=2975399 RepID=UPI00244B5318|nr:AraC family transcriptional regulator [Mitsuaria sp. GD03876]MDH0862979.1 AraC family transcriptional regulator [Mitsuaria sp. GD03876]
MADDHWIQLRRDARTGIETVRAHFTGHAYDPHGHDELLIGITQQGVQRFHCGRALHTSTPGRAILIEPGAVHDGHAPEEAGFTYAMLYLPQDWTARLLERHGLGGLSAIQPAFRDTLAEDRRLFDAIGQAFDALHAGEARLACDQHLDRLVALLARHVDADAAGRRGDSSRLAERARELLHDRMAGDIGLDDLAAHTGMDRFRLTRQFKQTFGQSPHAYLVGLRLRTARALLARGHRPSEVAAEVGFADQSHLGRWFQRAYRLTPADYRRRCTNVLDPDPPSP